MNPDNADNNEVEQTEFTIVSSETSKTSETSDITLFSKETLEKKNWNKKIKKEKIRVVVSQTGYSEEEAIDKLTKFDWDCKKAIKFYLTDGCITTSQNNKSLDGIKDDGNQQPSTHCSENDLNKTINNQRSINQQIYGEIRGLMDDASRTYYRNKERDALMSEYLNRNTNKPINDA